MNVLDARIMTKLSTSLVEKNQIHLTAAQLNITFTTEIFEIRDHELVLKNPIPLDMISNFLNAGPFHLHITQAKLEANMVFGEGRHLVFPIDRSSLKEEERTAQRYFFSPKEGAYLGFKNPYDKDTYIKKNLIDLSLKGMSFKQPFKSDLFQLGSRYENVDIFIEDQIFDQVHIEIVHQRKIIDLNGNYYIKVGAKFLTS